MLMSSDTSYLTMDNLKNPERVAHVDMVVVHYPEFVIDVVSGVADTQQES